MTKAGVCYAILECINIRVIIPKKIIVKGFLFRRVTTPKSFISRSFYSEEVFVRKGCYSEFRIMTSKLKSSE